MPIGGHRVGCDLLVRFVQGTLVFFFGQSNSSRMNRTDGWRGIFQGASSFFLDTSECVGNG